MNGTTKMEKRGRVTIPIEIREKLHLRAGQRFLVKEKDGEIVLQPMIDKEEFRKELKGCVKGSKIKPLEVKKIWETPSS